jgi:G3E family GTPase
MERNQHPYIRRLLRTPSSTRHLARARAGVPLTFVAGEPGAGKSTLLARLASLPQKRNIAVMTHDHDTSSRLAELGQTVDHAFLEVGSTSDLRRANGYAYLPGFRPCGLVIVLSAPSVLAMRPDTLPERIQDASVVVINKADLLSGFELQRATGWLSRAIAPLPLVYSRNGDVAAQLFLGVDQTTSGDDMPMVVAPWTHAFEVSGTRGARNVRALCADKCRAWSLHANAPVDPIAFRSWVERLPRTVIRGHGSVTFQMEPPVQHRFELFGAHWGLERHGQVDRTVTQSKVFLVGLA